MNIIIHGLDELVKDATNAGLEVKPLMRGMLNNSVSEITARTRKLAPHATGTLQRSIMPERNYPVARVKVNAPYGSYVENGTRPHWPPIGAIAAWAAKKGIGDAKGYRATGKGSTPFLIARAISKRGTKAQPFWKPGIEQSVPLIDREMRLVADRLFLRIRGKA
ncbi:MAG TPA: HK97-gp10 family putative phage morphogenesis protein [Patescibacteria group bacterium]|jgi:HK97 gp10 family phage protein|nr:HK97-gp10 family putative phage morphogenesis protein [Patescibacteria group bacterium]